MCDQCAKVCKAITELRSTEGGSVEIVADNSDFDGPNNMIWCRGNWTGWEQEHFTGDTILQALEEAVKQKKLAEQPSQVDMALARAGMLDNT